MDSKAEYFRRRAEQEALAADCATDQRAKAAHLELAQRYRDAAAESSQSQAIKLPVSPADNRLAS